MDIRIQPSRLSGTVTPPPSQSQGHRLLICAALASGESRLSRLGDSEDMDATVRCLTVLGANFRREGGDCVVTGLGGKPRHFPTLPQLDCGESGSTLRFLIPIALAVAGGGVFTGRGRLMERPQQPYFDLFDEQGISYTQENGALTVRGALTPGAYRLPGDVSSQFFSGLLFALPLLDGPSTIVPTTAVESWDYIRMTVDALTGAGVPVTVPDDGANAFAVSPLPYRPFSQTVEADWSQAGFWYAARALGNAVETTGLDPRSAQGDRVIADHFPLLTQPGDSDIDLSGCPDLAPPLAVMAAVRQGTTRLVNAGRLRIKESDRLAAISDVLTALGAAVTEGADSLTITGRDTLTGGVTVDAHNDHRIAMMTAIAATRCEQPVVLQGADCVKKSYPLFWEDYAALGGVVHVL